MEGMSDHAAAEPARGEIVEDLLRLAAEPSLIGRSDARAARLLRDAADEIRRLRALASAPDAPRVAISARARHSPPRVRRSV